MKISNYFLSTVKFWNIESVQLWGRFSFLVQTLCVFFDILLMLGLLILPNTITTYLVLFLLKKKLLIFLFCQKSPIIVSFCVFFYLKIKIRFSRPLISRIWMIFFVYKNTKSTILNQIYFHFYVDFFHQFFCSKSID